MQELEEEEAPACAVVPHDFAKQKLLVMTSGVSCAHDHQLATKQLSRRSKKHTKNIQCNKSSSIFM
jgi:hypothetical protein